MIHITLYKKHSASPTDKAGVSFNLPVIGSLICALAIHFPKFAGFNFTDKVSGEDVNDYKCERCGKAWMANNKYDRFKCYKETTVNEDKIRLFTEGREN